MNAAHPKPSDMAREAFPSETVFGSAARLVFAEGVVAERKRVAEWLDALARACEDEHSALLHRLADELEGKVQP